jgi:hypothetical protein
MLRVTATLPSFLRNIVDVTVVPGVNVPHEMLDKALVHPLSEYTPNCTVAGDGGGDEGEGVITWMLPVFVSVRVVTRAPKPLAIRPITAKKRTVPKVALRIAIMLHLAKIDV